MKSYLFNELSNQPQDSLEYFLGVVGNFNEGKTEINF